MRSGRDKDLTLDNIQVVLLDTKVIEDINEAKNSVDALQFLIESGADLQARNLRGETPLHLAATAGCPEACR